jgi:putative redox protein
MTEDSPRRIDMTRLAKGRYRVTNARGGTLTVGSGNEDDTFTPVELLLTAIAACSAADVDFITAKRAEPTGFSVTMTGDKIRDEQGNRLENLVLSFDIAFPEDEGGRAAAAVLPRAVRQSHDRLCTVSRTVEVGTPITARIVDESA